MTTNIANKLAWTYVTNFNDNGTYDIGSTDGISEVMFVLFVGYRERQTVIVPRLYFEWALPDFSFANTRLYFNASISGTSMIISSYTDNTQTSTLRIDVFKR